MSTRTEAKPSRKNRGRGAGEGTIYSREEVRTRKRQDGTLAEYHVERWQAVVDLGVKNGKRQRKYLTGRTREEVARKLNAALHERDQGRSGAWRGPAACRGTRL